MRVIGSILVVCLFAAYSPADEPVSFRNQIAPLLVDNCLACHGAKKTEGGYRVDTYEGLIGEGDSASLGFAPGNLEDSEAYRRITSDDESERMPLESDPLQPEAIALVKRWIEEGAKFDGPDPKAPLSTIVPVTLYPDPPDAYSRTLPITALAFSASGEEIYVSGYHELTVWSTSEGRLLRRIKNIPQRTYAIALGPDGRALAVCGGAPGRSGDVRLVDPATGDVIKVLGAGLDVILDAAFSPAGDRLAAGGADSVIRIYDVAGSLEDRLIESHADWVMAVAWSPDGSRLASASRDKTAKLFDAQSGEALVTYTEHAESVQGVAFHPGGEQVFSAGADSRVHLWKMADAAKLAEVGRLSGQVYKLVAGGDSLFAPSDDKTVVQYELASHKPVRTYSEHQDSVLCAAYHTASQRLATGSFDGEVRIFSAADGRLLITFTAAPGYAPPTK